MKNFYEDTLINVTCNTLPAYPMPHIFWTTPDNKTYHSPEGRLVKFDAKASDDGVYTCHVVNIVGSVEIKYSIQIHWQFAILDCLGNYKGVDLSRSGKNRMLEECEQEESVEIAQEQDGTFESEGFNVNSVEKGGGRSGGVKCENYMEVVLCLVLVGRFL